MTGTAFAILAMFFLNPRSRPMCCNCAREIKMLPLSAVPEGEAADAIAAADADADGGDGAEGDADADAEAEEEEKAEDDAADEEDEEDLPAGNLHGI